MIQKTITYTEDKKNHFYYFDNICTINFSIHNKKRHTVHILCWC